MFKAFVEDTSSKKQTLKHVYHVIHEQGPMTRKALIQKLKIKQTTMNRIIDELLHHEFISETGYEPSSGGRPPALYQINPDAGYVIGIDLSRSHTKIVLVDLSFRIRSRETFSMTRRETPERVIERINKIIASFMQQYDSIIGIGIGTVGPLDRKHGRILNPESFPAPGWENIPIVNQLQEAFPGRIMLENGANTAALGEYFQSEAIGENMLYCISGEGLRCGYLANGQLVRSRTGEVSAIEHMIIDVDGKRCTCGNVGCLKQYITLKAIYEELRLKASRHSSIDTLEQLIHLLKQGDPSTEAVVKKTAYYHGIGLANMINLLQPDHVILSGPLIYAYPPYYEQVVKVAQATISKTKQSTVHFSTGALRGDAAAIGAAYYVFQSFFHN